jgi:uncharacterized membrane protein HdeD (DUF308 family)
MLLALGAAVVIIVLAEHWDQVERRWCLVEGAFGLLLGYQAITSLVNGDGVLGTLSAVLAVVFLYSAFSWRRMNAPSPPDA